MFQRRSYLIPSVIFVVSSYLAILLRPTAMMAATSLRGLPRCHRWAERLGNVGICSVAPRVHSSVPGTIECSSLQHPPPAHSVHRLSSTAHGQRASSIVPFSHTPQLRGCSSTSASWHSRQRPSVQLCGRACVRHVSYASKADMQQDITDGVLVVLVGWLGARQRYLDKYAQLWRQLPGCTAVLPLRPPISSILMPPLGDALAARAVAECQEQLSRLPSSTRVLLHVFSGGGYIFAGSMLRGQGKGAGEGTAGAELAAPWDRLSGIIFDSSPAPVTADVASRAMVSAVLAEPAEGVEQRHPRLVQGFGQALGAYLALDPISARLADLQGFWAGPTAPKCPQLYLYSETDALVPPETVQAFMGLQEGRGCEVQGMCWPHSGHVEHYRAYPEEYRARLEGFVQHVMFGGVVGEQDGAAGKGAGQAVLRCDSKDELLQQ